MKDRNSPEAIAERATQTDPIVMYLIVRESLGMSVGKTAAQCAHASQILLLEYVSLTLHTNPCDKPAKQVLFKEWLDTSFRKVVLRASDHQFRRMKKEVTDHIIVVDAGLTEIDPGSETVLGLWPMRKSQAPKYLQKLQVLK